jgi:hypothetical protein
MVSTSDFLSLEYSDDLTEAGIAYTRKWFASIPDPREKPDHNMLRNIIAGVAVELAFRRYLNREQIPHNNLDATPFTDPDRLDIIIGGRRCDINLSIITRKRRIRQTHKDPKILLNERFFVTRDQTTSGHLDDEDLYIFAFLSALVTPNQRSLDRAVQSNQPVFLVHWLPSKWSRCGMWYSLEKLVFKNEGDDDVNLGIDGLDANRKFQTEQITLNSSIETAGMRDFYTLGFLHTTQLPEGNLSVQSQNRKATHQIQPIHWGNIWVYGMQITLAGYVTRGELQNRGGGRLESNRPRGHLAIPSGSLSIQVSELNPLRDLFKRAKAWDKNRDKPRHFH